ncbi:gastrokine-2 [Alligator mississippiensis]|uniref:Gastrokine-2 n=1 Tax=Alligator mississippiensis TaxID=8496 RepID=A0A151P504_ALLMI|nr:gastrokine-2 [Alligator mississippiensis]KYO44151.1 gastrokine-2 [Alligator mississippiensis]
MNMLAALIAVLGVLWTQAAAYHIYTIPSPGRDYVLQTVTIDNTKDTADIHVRNGLCSSDTIFDYKHGYIATRVFSQRACFIMKMEKGYTLTLEDIGRLAYERQMMTKMYSPTYWWVQYEPADSIIAEMKEWLLYGDAIEGLCKGVPLYGVHKVESGINSGGCFKTGILGILHISVCGKVHV